MSEFTCACSDCYLKLNGNSQTMFTYSSNENAHMSNLAVQSQFSSYNIQNIDSNLSGQSINYAINEIDNLFLYEPAQFIQEEAQVYDIFNQPTSNEHLIGNNTSSSSSANCSQSFFNNLDAQSNASSESNSVLSEMNTNVQQMGKPKETFVDIIARAILSSNDNKAQLKDIYNYIVDNYSYFAAQSQSNKWRNSVRHNLSRHKYFVKTVVKNSHGHFWSIHPSYVKLLKNGSSNTKEIKRLKVNAKPRKSSSSKAQQQKSAKNISSIMDTNQDRENNVNNSIISAFESSSYSFLEPNASPSAKSVFNSTISNGPLQQVNYHEFNNCSIVSDSAYFSDLSSSIDYQQSTMNPVVNYKFLTNATNFENQTYAVLN